MDTETLVELVVLLALVLCFFPLSSLRRRKG